MEKSMPEVVCVDQQNISFLEADEETQSRQHQENSEHYDYFSPALMDCWPSVVEHLTAPGDLQALAKILPIVIKKGYLSRNSLLSTRQLNRESRQAADDFLFDPSSQSKHEWLSSAFKLERKAEITRFMGSFSQCTLKNSLSSKLLRLGVKDSESLDQVLNLLQQNGTHLRNFGLELFFAANSSRLCHSLIRVLSLIPNVQYLLLKMGLNLGSFGEDRHPAYAASFPLLKTLTNLTLVAQSSGLTTLLEDIVQVYGPQLKELSLHPHPDVSGYDIQVSNWRLDNLTRLEISNIDCFKIFQFKMPKVETLSFADGYIEPHVSRAVRVFRRPENV